MKKPWILGMLLTLAMACGPDYNIKKKEPSRTQAEKERLQKVDKDMRLASDQTHQFLNWLYKTLPQQPAVVTDKLRNKVLNRTDAKEALKFVGNNGLKKSNFEGWEDSVQNQTYQKLDLQKISGDITWIDHHRLRGCRKISKEAMWDCLQQDYEVSYYYYFSPPVFSADGNYAMISLNYMNKESSESYGGGRLYKRKTLNTWEEVALLSYWGKVKTD